MQNPTQIQVQEMHAEYQKLTGLQISLAGREWTWWEWLKRGLNLQDLRNIVHDKKRRIRAKELPEQSLMFRNLAGNVDYAEEDAMHLRAKGRTPRPHAASSLSPLAKAVTEIRTDAKPVADVLAGMKAFDQFRALKNQL